jgi:hypothetical protein
MSKSKDQKSSSGVGFTDIVGAISSGVTFGGQKKAQSDDYKFKTSSIAPSEEFMAFWGESVDPAWFQERKMPSPFLIGLTILTIFTLYLCVGLIFSPGEFEQSFLGSGEVAYKEDNSVIQPSDEEFIEDLSKRKIQEKQLDSQASSKH